MSFPPGTEMFQFPGFASLTLFYSGQDTWFAPLTTSPTGSHPRTTTSAKHQVGCPIRRSTDQSLFPAPRSLSQGITSFIASCCQGIHQTPFSRLIRSRERKAGLLRPGPLLGHAFLRPRPSVCGSHTFSPPRLPCLGPRQRLVYLTWNEAALDPHALSGLRRRRPPLTREGPNGFDVLSSRCHLVVLIGRESAAQGTRPPRRSPVR